MEQKKATVSSSQFLNNFQLLKRKFRSPLPSDVISYKCKSCNLELPLTVDGVLEISSPVEKNIGILIKDMVKCMMKSHTEEMVGCVNFVGEHASETPENILLSFPESDIVHIEEFELANYVYKLKLVVLTENSNEKAIFALFQKATVSENIYSDLINSNFNAHLNNQESFNEEMICDDDSALYYQQQMPRSHGGGRKLNDDFNYECLWCPKEVIKLGKKGRFKEFRSYRDHFKEFHHGEDGIGVSMADFLEKVHRIDPKWYCKNCDRHYSLGSVVYHKAVCKQSDQDVTETESENIESVEGPSNRKKSLSKRRKYVIYSDSSSDDCEAEEDSVQLIPSLDVTTAESMVDTTATGQINKEPNISDKYEWESEEIEEGAVYSNYKSKAKTKDKTSSELSDKDPKRNNQDDSDTKSEKENNPSKIKAKKRVKVVNTDYTFLDVGDEIYCTSFEMDQEEEYLEPKVEIPEEPDFQIEVHVTPSTTSNEEAINKWWLKVPKHLYGDKGLGGPPIFLPNDSEEFVKRCTIKYKTHMLEKKDLDRKMKEAENADAQLLQFSLERDKPILEHYTAFVKTFSTKDALNIFSEEYEQLNIPTGAKSSTAAQYTNRIMEFFKFMSKLYHNFHLDWMVDYKGQIEKVYKDGSVSTDLFLPSKEDFQDFTKQFKYGGNISKNCKSVV